MNFKKVLAGACAGAMVFSMCAVPVFAEETETDTYEIVSKDTIKFSVEELKAAAVETITFDFDFSNEGSYGGGAVGYNTCLEDGSYGSWTSQDWSNDGTTSITIAVDNLFFESADDPQDIQVQVWWQSGGDGVPVVLNVTKTYAEEEPVVDEPAVVECAYTDGKTPSYSYTVQNNVSAITADIVYLPDQEDGSFNFNDWCGNGVIVTHPDGTKTYYQWGGAQVSWGWDADGDEVDDSVGGVNGETWLGTVVDRQATLTIPVEQGAVVDFLCLGWDSYAGTQYTVAVSGDVAGSEEDPSEEQPSEEDPSEEQSSEETPSQEDPSNNDVGSTPSNPDGDVAPVAGLAVVAAAALAVAAVSFKKKANA